MRFLTHCSFRKHRDKPWEDVVVEDPSYVRWLLSMDGPELSMELRDKLTELMEDAEDEDTNWNRNQGRFHYRDEY